MLTFSSFLAEAEFSEDNFGRLISAFEKRMPKLLGSQLYRLGGSSGVEKLSGATGYVYFIGSTGKAFRVRAKGGHVIGLDIWKEYHPNKGPAFVADMADISAGSIIAAMSKIAAIIKNPSAGEIEVPLREDLQLDEMAKRTTPADFYKLMVDKYGEEAAQSASNEQIKSIAAEHDILIPSFIWGTGIGKGRTAKFNTKPGGSKAAADEPKGDAPAPKDEPKGDAPKDEPKADKPVDSVKVQPTGKKDPILYIKVTAQDPDSKRFISAADNAAAQKLYAQLSKSVNGPGTEAEMKDPDTLYGHMAQLVSMACKGTLRSLLIYGGPGTGKTFTIMKTVNDMGMVKGTDYVKLSGKASPIEIYKTLYMYRESGLVIFDDLDSMWRNEDATNILKAALDTSPVREISWVSNQTINVSKMDDARKATLFRQIDAQLNGEVEAPPPEDDDEEDPDADATVKRKKKKKDEAPTIDPTKIKYPSTFDFKGRVVFISNLKKEDFDTAIMSRSAKINMDLSPSQILERMRKILPTLGGTDVSVEQKEELLDHLLHLHQQKEITAVTMREFTKGLDIVRSGAPNWKELVIYA
jgi:hypothetical protein